MMTQDQNQPKAWRKRAKQGAVELLAAFAFLALLGLWAVSCLAIFG